MALGTATAATNPDYGSLRTEDFEALVDAALGGQALDWDQIKRDLSSIPTSNDILDSAGHSVAKRSPVNPFAPIKLPIVAGTCAFLKTLTLPIFPVAWPPIYKACFVFGNLSTGLGRKKRSQSDNGSLRTEDFEALVDAALGGQALDWNQIKRDLSSIPTSNDILDSAGHSVDKRSPINPFAPIKVPIVLGTCALLKTLTLPIFPVAWPPIFKKCLIADTLSTGIPGR